MQWEPMYRKIRLGVRVWATSRAEWFVMHICWFQHAIWTSTKINCGYRHIWNGSTDILLVIPLPRTRNARWRRENNFEYLHRFKPSLIHYEGWLLMTCSRHHFHTAVLTTCHHMIYTSGYIVLCAQSYMLRFVCDIWGQKRTIKLFANSIGSNHRHILLPLSATCVDPLEWELFQWMNNYMVK